MKIVSSPRLVRELALEWKRTDRIAFVPTMGCLHEGHLALVRHAWELADRVVASIFVNPLQFGPNEDLAKYPRTFEEDRRRLEALGVDLLFHPSVEDLYPAGFSTRVKVGGLAEHLCGRSRPGHFEGVATVCLKLFEITRADIAVFGEKDWQQLKIVQRMATDFDLPIEITPHPTVREGDGLALSSRNRYLSPEERLRATAVPQSARLAAELLVRQPSATAGECLDLVGESLRKGDLSIDYIAIAPADTLVPAAPTERVLDVLSPRVFLAVRCGATRLIDNHSLELPAR